MKELKEIPVESKKFEYLFCHSQERKFEISNLKQLKKSSSKTSYLICYLDGTNESVTAETASEAFQKATKPVEKITCLQ